jgi:undecaprenyl diphosphate synthase
MLMNRQNLDESLLQADLMPAHVAIIMDGNGRWAKQRGKPRVWGHKNGVDSVREAVRTAGELGIKALTLYAFSEENWGRPREEVSALMSLLNTYVVKERSELNKQNVRFKTVGNLNRLPVQTRKLVNETVKALSKNTGLTLTIALSYGSRSEIVEASKKIATHVLQGDIKPEEISSDMFTSFLMTAGLPEIDLIIRTSGEQRLSNFMLWQAAYSEFYFTPTFWPDFKKADLIEAILCYQKRNRRFGKLPDENASHKADYDTNKQADQRC